MRFISYQTILENRFNMLKIDAINPLKLPPADSVQNCSPGSVMPRKIEEEQRESAQKAKKLELLNKLYTSPYRDRKDRNPERVDGTCEWFTNHPLFRSWQGSKTSSLLWVSADPGCGSGRMRRSRCRRSAKPCRSG